MRSGRLGQNGSTTLNSYKPPPRLTSASEAQKAVTEIRKCVTTHGAYHDKSTPAMSALGQQWTFRSAIAMSVLLPKANFLRRDGCRHSTRTRRCTKSISPFSHFCYLSPDL